MNLRTPALFLFDVGRTSSEKNRLADLAIRVGGQTLEVSLKYEELKEKFAK